MNIFSRARIRYILHRYPIPHELWLETETRLALLHGLSAVDKARLREIATVFLHEKNFVGAQGFELDSGMCVAIAAQVALPLLNLGFKRLSGWTDVIVYPGPFRVSRDETGADGVTHRRERSLSGESWLHGPLILSWTDIKRDMRWPHHGFNVIIHEIAHKLDALNGVCNGFPPLHAGMRIEEWTRVMSAAYASLVEGRGGADIDAYAAESPAEFFAVVSEYFFSAPRILHGGFAEVYGQLKLYYRQDPLSRENQILKDGNICH